MFDTPQIRTDAMPQEMRFLLDTYPRESWETHPGFKDKTRQWLRAHMGFRQLADIVRTDTEDYLDRELSSDTYAARLSRYGNQLVGHLHGHHAWEDMEYFPELGAADPRFEAGLDLLEKDHADLDQVLEGFILRANRVLKLVDLDEAQAFDEAGSLHQDAATIEAFLQRHLADEEELAVPIILHHRLRG